MLSAAVQELYGKFSNSWPWLKSYTRNLHCKIFIPEILIHLNLAGGVPSSPIGIVAV